MALSIKNEDADRLARELSAETGESLTEAVVISIQERLERVKRSREPSMVERLDHLSAEVVKMPIYDARTDEEIIGYGEDGLPR